MDRANNIFDQIDTDKSGGIDKGEITIHLLSLGQEQETVMEMFALLDADNDGLISREEFINGFQKYQEFCKLSTNNQSGKASAKAPPPSFAALIAAGTVVPDEQDGPYALRSYHDNVTGAHRGYKAEAGYDAWFDTNDAIMARQTSWATIDFEAEDAVDPEYMFSYGTINGRGVAMQQLRPTVIEAQAAMKAGNGAAFESARGKQGAAAGFDRITALAEISGKVQQPGGDQLDLVGLYKGALGAVGELWAYGQRAIAASGEAGVAASWGIKKANRIWFKLATKYGGDVSKVTDCARISLEFATAEGLERAATFVLQSASTFKNRVANPTDEGYRDLMFTVLIERHVCEVQLHLVEMIKAKKSGAGHKMYKVCRRVLHAPIVKENTYCLEVVGKELRGEGEVNAQGEPEGRGTMVYADGDMYEGQWRAGEMHGQGKYTFATGNVYEGEFVEDEMHGHGKYSASIGDVYEGEFVAGKRHGRGKFTSADGNSYEGEYAEGKQHGKGTETYADGASYEGEYAEDKKHGKGTYTFASGASYEGEWAEGNMHGKGTVTNPNGAVCLGRFEAGPPVGQGVMWSADRTEAWELQAGEEVRGIPLDEAAQIAERIGLPSPYEGGYVAGKYHGHGKITYGNGASYEGEFAEGKMHGKGTFTYADGTEFKVYQGEFLHDKRHGRGKITYTNGNSHDGEYAEDKEHGHGTFTFADGKVQIGYYKPGEPYVGHGVHVGQGVHWSADRTEAWEVQDGEPVRGIPLDEAAKIAERIGLPPP